MPGVPQPEGVLTCARARLRLDHQAVEDAVAALRRAYARARRVVRHAVPQVVRTPIRQWLAAHSGYGAAGIGRQLVVERVRRRPGLNRQLRGWVVEAVLIARNPAALVAPLARGAAVR